MSVLKIKWKTSGNDRFIIDRIADRANEMNCDYQVKDCRMDITAVHLNGNPLQLEKLLKADYFNFAHDVFGINRHIDRNTGKLLNHFSPRYSK